MTDETDPIEVAEAAARDWGNDYHGRRRAREDGTPDINPAVLANLESYSIAHERGWTDEAHRALHQATEYLYHLGFSTPGAMREVERILPIARQNALKTLATLDAIPTISAADIARNELGFCPDHDAHACAWPEAKGGVAGWTNFWRRTATCAECGKTVRRGRG